MAIIKCKMCGGDIALSEDRTTGTCEYCGSLMTFPKVSDEQRLNLFNRANHFRRQGEFDRAISAYEKILELDDADAEAHWGAVLSRYGIEYVEDPSSGERIPTCHRVQPTSILTDGDYEAALRYAPDGASRALYESEAHRIAEIQKDILAVSAREKPCDVFICYKESDDAGSRTVDSTLAQEIYYQLTNEGYKVFFARITLEDKLGREYEPYIFAALNSAKVMLVVGTKPEHFNAVWVKNEWSRYLDLMKKDRSRLLIPCYRDMDPYDLPDALSSLQSQDMAKIGFIQDLIRGVKKVLDAGKQEVKAVAAPVAEVAAPGVASLCARAELFLERGEWEKVDEYAERVLDIDPKYAPAYMLKVCAALKVRQEADLAKQQRPFDDNGDYQLALRFATPAQRQIYEGYERAIQERLQKKDYLQAVVNVVQRLQRARERAEQKALKARLMAEQKAREARERAEWLAREASENADYIRCQVECNRLDEQYKTVIEQKERAFQEGEARAAALEVRFRGIKERKADIEKARDEALYWISTYEQSISESRKELSALKGLFAGKRRRELDAGISDKERKLNVLRQNLQQAERDLQQCSREADGVSSEIRQTDQACDGNALRALILEAGNAYRAHGIIERAQEMYDRIRDAQAVRDILSSDAYILAKAEAVAKKNARLERFRVGNIVGFGKYRQDGAPSFETPDLIEWIVLENDGKSALMISKYGLDARAYHEQKTDITWENCSLRKWLNGDFVNEAFTPDEQTLLETMTVTADNNPAYSTDPGRDTQDRVWLLSVSEVKRNFDTNKLRMCGLTDYAVAQGALRGRMNEVDERPTCGWWLRSPGRNSGFAAFVYQTGDVFEAGSEVDHNYYAVRPVIRLRIN